MLKIARAEWRILHIIVVSTLWDRGDSRKCRKIERNRYGIRAEEMNRIT